MSFVRVMISGQRKAFHDQMKDRITLVAIAGFDSGSMMRPQNRHVVQTIDSRASCNERDTASKLDLKTKMQMMVESSGRARPR